VPNAGPHDHRKDDPYDAAFFEHLSHITTPQSLNVISTKASDEWICATRQAARTSKRRAVHQQRPTHRCRYGDLRRAEEHRSLLLRSAPPSPAKLTLNARTGPKSSKSAIAAAALTTKVSGSSASIRPNLESISLAHAKFTDAGAAHLAKLTKLKGPKSAPRTLRPPASSTSPASRWSIYSSATVSMLLKASLHA